VFTPREAILFSACLRLAPTISHADKVKRTEKLLEQLGLVNCADTYVRNLSGGERKRTSIGVELVSDPRGKFYSTSSLLFFFFKKKILIQTNHSALLGRAHERSRHYLVTGGNAHRLAPRQR